MSSFPQSVGSLSFENLNGQKKFDFEEIFGDPRSNDEFLNVLVNHHEENRSLRRKIESIRSNFEKQTGFTSQFLPEIQKNKQFYAEFWKTKKKLDNEEGSNEILKQNSEFRRTFELELQKLKQENKFLGEETDFWEKMIQEFITSQQIEDNYDFYPNKMQNSSNVLALLIQHNQEFEGYLKNFASQASELQKMKSSTSTCPNTNDPEDMILDISENEDDEKDIIMKSNDCSELTNDQILSFQDFQISNPFELPIIPLESEIESKTNSVLRKNSVSKKKEKVISKMRDYLKTDFDSLVNELGSLFENQNKRPLEIGNLRFEMLEILISEILKNKDQKSNHEEILKRFETIIFQSFDSKKNDNQLKSVFEKRILEFLKIISKFKELNLELNYLEFGEQDINSFFTKNKKRKRIVVCVFELSEKTKKAEEILHKKQEELDHQLQISKKLEIQIEDLKKKNKDLEEQLRNSKKFEKQAETLKSQNLELQSSNSRLKKELQDLKNEMEAKTKSLEQTIKSKTKRIDQTTQETKDLKSEIDAKNQIIGRLNIEKTEIRKNLDSFKQEFDPNFVNFQKDKNLNTKTDGIIEKIDDFFNSDQFLTLKQSSLSILGPDSKNDDGLGMKIHVFWVKQLLEGTETKIYDIMKKNKFCSMSETKSFFSQNRDSIIQDIISNSKNSFSTHFGTVVEMQEDSVSTVFEICFDMKKLKLNFIFPKEKDFFSSELHNPSNPQIQLTTTCPTVLRTTSPGIIFSKDVQTWKNMILKRADVELQC